MSAALPLIEARAGFYRDVRIGLGLSQSDFGALVNAHSVTVSNWERGHRRPDPNQQALIASFQLAIDRDAPIRPDLDAIIASAGPTYALYLILHAAHGVA